MEPDKWAKFAPIRFDDSIKKMGNLVPDRFVIRRNKQIRRNTRFAKDGRKKQPFEACDIFWATTQLVNGNKNQLVSVWKFWWKS